MDQPSDHPRSTEAWAIIDPDGRILIRYIGPHPHTLKSQFRRFNKRLDWKGYSCAKVRIETIP